MVEFNESLFEQAKLEKPYHLLVEPCEQYAEAIKLLEKLRDKGKLTFDADSMAEPYVNHLIFINWSEIESEGMTELDAKEIANVLNNVGVLSIDEKGNWILLATLYEKL